MRKLIVLLLICIPSLVFSQEFLNLNFEYEIKGTNIPLKWRINNTGYKIEVDAKEKASSARSLIIKSNHPTAGQFGGCANSFPVDLVRGKSIEFTGKIKTKNINKGYAGLWWRVDGEKGSVGFDKMENRGITGTQDWKKVSIKMKIADNATDINFGALLSGEGTAWFDDLEIFIDGEKFTDLKPRLTEPTLEELAWLKRYIYPLKTFEPNTVANQDLKVLKQLIGDAEVVALGEVSHGSSEVFKMKHRIIKYLAKNENFDTFSIEANMPESYRLNEYIIEGKGNPTELIKGMQLWTWSTQEVLNMVEWMKTHNKSKQKIQFTGFDMQSFFGPLQELELAFQVEGDILQNISKLKKELVAVTDQTNVSLLSNVSPEKIKIISSLINSIKESISTSELPKLKKEWLLQNTRILEQLLDNNSISRDKYMAENLLWIKAQNRKSKIALWAHNGHIKKSGHSMGKYLSDSLTNNYLTIGFSFHKGNYTAVGDNGLTNYKAQDAYLGTYEYFFNAIKEPVFILDLRAAKQDNSKNGEWLLQNSEFRTVGSTKMEYEFTQTKLINDFDLIIFINESSHSKLLN